MHARPLLALAAALAAGGYPRGARAACEPEPVLVEGIGTPASDLLRAAQLAVAAPLVPDLIRRAGARTGQLCASGEGFAWASRLPTVPGEARVAVLPVTLESAWSSTHPTAANDGLLWAGRGVSALLRAGVYGRAGALSAAIAPEVAWQQNAWFETVPTGGAGNLAFANPWYGGGFDAPQRFGAGPFTRTSLGQSFLRLDAYGAALGISTENLWLGPGLRNALLLTNAGPGFPHLFLGTSAPVDIRIGKLEALALWGRLDRSRYSADTGSPAFTALALDWEPRWVPGLYLGAARAFVESWASLRSDAFLSIVEPPWKSSLPGGDNPQDNQIAVVWFRWVLPAVALELYGEYGKDDFPASVGALIRETEHTAAWVAGLQKLARVGTRWLRVQVEVASLYDGTPLGLGSSPPSFYVHGAGLGFTDGGQPLGSYAGPGGSAQALAVDLLGRRGRLGVFAERLERNEQLLWRLLDRRGTDRDTEITAGLRAVLLAGPVELAWEAAGGYRWNRDFIRNEPNARLFFRVAVPGRPAPGAIAYPYLY